MLEQDSLSSPTRTEASHRNFELNNSLAESTAATNTSIIGKVKSRVSSIFPNSLSKWFSPSTRNTTEPLNGSINIGGVARRRRRLEIEDDDDEYCEEEDDEDDPDDADDDEDDEPDEQEADEFEENMFERQHDNSDEDSNNSEEAEDATAGAISTTSTSRNTPRNLLRSRAAVQQPPTKRSRLNADNAIANHILNTTLMPHPPLVASTPNFDCGGSNIRSSAPHSSAMKRSTGNRYTYLNLYGNQARKDPPYSFQPSPVTKAMTKSDEAPRYVTTDIIDLMPEQAVEDSVRSSEAGLMGYRRNLNIDPPSETQFRNVKTSSLARAAHNISSYPPTTLPRRTSTTILETQSHPIPEESEQVDGDVEDDGGEESAETRVYNGREERISTKRQKLTNGAGDRLSISNTTEDVNLRDSVSESSDGNSKSDNMASGSRAQTPRKAAELFNMSAPNRQNGSRSSSFGNGLNFSSHLGGRKSLFTGSTQAGNPSLNNSTLSLTSLNRRQFNASIYGSTSALSDSRLLNTFSPFYKGRTTYGGAAAYNKYSMMCSGTGANSMRVAPIMIRPTSSLSTLSSSNNSVAAGSPQAPEPTSAISSTAKRILDLINDFSTPLSEAKKMASHLKPSHQQQQRQQHNQSLTINRRFNDTDLNTSRAIRLSQVQRPYARPSVTLQPKPMKPTTVGSPPVRELQVPTMSQLLQMKKLQQTTERSRRIVTDNNDKVDGAAVAEYTLPVESSAAEGRSKEHINKIKTKITGSARITSSKDSLTSVCIMDSAQPAPANLPNIAFPLMESVPKFDIALPNTKISKQPAAEAVVSSSAANTAPTSKSTSISLSSSLALPSSTIAENFKFSPPLEVESVCKITPPPQDIVPVKDDYKFSPPLIVEQTTAVKTQAEKTETGKMEADKTEPVKTTPISAQTEGQESQPQLKTGSVLEALKKPLVLPVGQTDASIKPPETNNDPLFAQFKKPMNEWECDTCMIRNKQDDVKCVACETPRKSPTTSTVDGSSKAQQAATSVKSPQTNSSAASSFSSQLKTSTPSLAADAPTNKNSFGDIFKPKPNTWECPTCLIHNKSDSCECVACETRKPSTSVTPSVPPKLEVPLSSSNSFDFKQLAAAQKASKWECNACMTHNDEARLKCICCEQPKSGFLASESAPKISFGATAATKFTFGFGTQNAPKEDELRQSTETESATEVSKIKEVPTPGFGFVFSAPSTSATSVTVAPKANAFTNNSAGFVFGIKTATSDVGADVNNTKEASAADGNKSTATSALTGFRFGAAVVTTSANDAPSSLTVSKSAVDSSSTTTSATITDFSFVTNTVTTAETKSTENVTSIASSGFKFPTPTLTTTTTATDMKTFGSSFESPKAINAVATSNFFGTTAPQPATSAAIPKPIQQPSPASGGFSFSLAKPADKPEEPAAAEASEKAAFSFKAPTATICSSSPTTVTNVSTSNDSFTLAATSQTDTSAKISTNIATTAAAVKPLFTFGAAASSPSSFRTASATTAATSSTAAPAAPSFSFGNIAAPTSTAPSLKCSLFGSPSLNTTTAAAAGTTTTTAAAATTTTTTEAAAATKSTTVVPTITSTAPVTNVFGAFAASSSAPTLNNTFSTAHLNVSSSSVTSSSNLGGSSAFGSTVAAASSSNIFGSFGSSSDTAKPKSTTAPISLFGTPSTTQSAGAFSFGSNLATTGATGSTITALGAVATTASSTTWSKNSFLFSSSQLTAAAPPSAAISEAPKAPAAAIFGASTFGSTPFAPTAVNNNAAASSVFGSNLQSAPSTSLSAAGPFGSSATGTPLFGASSVPAGSTSTTNLFGAAVASNAAPVAFGSAAFGSSAAPKFGITATPANAVNTFGGFGVSSTSTTDGASAAKKSEPAFNFAPQSSSGGFNFGASAANAKPAFNFSASAGAAANFNFTGSATERTNSTQPFQFGATSTPLAPVFNFGSGAAETTPNAPFQFSAGSAKPVSSNIFAPTPTSGGAQSSQQARRKIRAPVRRLTPR